MINIGKKEIFFSIILLILIGFFFRFYQLNFEDYWLDEMNSFWVADPFISFDEMNARTRLTDQTPLLFNLILKNYFKFFGYNPDFGRYVPFFFGVIAIPFLGILSYQVKKNSSFLFVILLASINIYLIKYSQETRPYSLVFLLSIINLIFYFKIILLNSLSYKKLITCFLFVIFSVLSLSSHPFVFIILFSQTVYSMYIFFFFKNRHTIFFFSIFFILILYFIFNYNYLIAQFTYKEYFLTQENWKFFYNFYFSRFFGSKIMGSIYLLTFLFLIFRFKREIFFRSNKYLLLVFIVFFSYLIPLLYGIIRTPVLTDRYIIFVLIPILILVSSLIFEINNKKLKTFLLIFILFPTIINHYIEINFRVNTKPEFKKILKNLNEHEIKNLTLLGKTKEHKLTENYIRFTNEFSDNNFNFFNIEKIPQDINKIWVLCYEPLTGFNCNVSIHEKKEWVLLESMKMHLSSANLFLIKK